MNQVWTTLLHHVRIDGCMCGLRESEKGDLVSKPWRIQSNFAHVKEVCRGLRCSHPYRHERCPEDSARWLYSRPLVRRAAQGILRSEQTAEELIGWLSEESFVMNPQNLEVDTSFLTDSQKSEVDTRALTDSHLSEIDTIFLTDSHKSKVDTSALTDSQNSKSRHERLGRFTKFKKSTRAP